MKNFGVHNDEVRKLMKKKGAYGMRVKGPNGNSIFLPATDYRYGSSLYYAGEYGYYWSSTPDESDSNRAYSLDFGSGSGNQLVYWCYRIDGQSVRPVSE